jgi:hypothetical protein
MAYEAERRGFNESVILLEYQYLMNRQHGNTVWFYGDIRGTLGLNRNKIRTRLEGQDWGKAAP